MCGGGLGLWQLPTEVLMDHQIMFVTDFCHTFRLGQDFNLKDLNSLLLMFLEKCLKMSTIIHLNFVMFLRPNIKLVFDPREDFSHHTANGGAPVSGKNPNLQPTRAQIFQLSLTSCNFHLATATNLVIIMWARLFDYGVIIRLIEIKVLTQNWIELYWNCVLKIIIFALLPTCAFIPTSRATIFLVATS